MLESTDAQLLQTIQTKLAILEEESFEKEAEKARLNIKDFEQ